MTTVGTQAERELLARYVRRGGVTQIQTPQPHAQIAPMDSLQQLERLAATSVFQVSTMAILIRRLHALPALQASTRRQSQQPAQHAQPERLTTTVIPPRRVWVAHLASTWQRSQQAPVKLAQRVNMTVMATLQLHVWPVKTVSTQLHRRRAAQIVQQDSTTTTL